MSLTFFRNLAEIPTLTFTHKEGLEVAMSTTRLRSRIATPKPKTTCGFEGTPMRALCSFQARASVCSKPKRPPRKTPTSGSSHLPPSSSGVLREQQPGVHKVREVIAATHLGKGSPVSSHVKEIRNGHLGPSLGSLGAPTERERALQR